MTKRWTGWVLMACLATAVPVQAQSLPVSGTAAPAPEPLPFAPTYAGPQQAAPGVGDAGCPSPLALPSDLDNAFMKPPKNDEFNNLYFGFEYLLWFLRGTDTAGPLATTTSTPNATNNFGALRQTTTAPLFAGDNKLILPGLNGARFTFGAAPSWFLPLEFSIFGVNGSKYFDAQSDGTGNPLIARPVFGTNLNTNNIPGSLTIIPSTQSQNVSYLASFPGEARGGVKITAPSKLWGVDAVVFADPLIGDMDAGGISLDLTFGYRYLNLNEQLNIGSSLQPIDPNFTANFLGLPFGPGNVTIAHDNFITQNTFNGGQVGIRGNYAVGPFIMYVKGNVAIGKTYETLKVYGTSTLWRAEEPAFTVPGGILAVASNSGTFTRDNWSVVPEVAINFELPVFSWLRFNVGYNFMYWTNVVRPASQVSTAIDTRQVPTDIDFSRNPNLSATSPPPSFTTSNFWAQGLTAGFAITY